MPAQPLGHKKSFVKDLRDKFLSSSKESSSTPPKSLRPSKSMADGLRHAFSSKQATEDAATLNVPGNAEGQVGQRQITKKKSFFRSLVARSSSKNMDLPAISATAEQTRPASPDDIEKALLQLRTPRQPERHTNFEYNCEEISLRLNPATGLPNGNKELQGTLEEWHAEAIRAMAVLDKLRDMPEAQSPEMVEARTQMYRLKDVTGNMLKALKEGTSREPNIVVNISRNSETQALAHIRVSRGAMHIEGLMSNPRNIFDLDQRGGVKGAGKTALDVIKAEAIKRGCSHIELKSLTERSTIIYRKAGYEKELDYMPDDAQPDMMLFLPKR